MTFSLDTNTCSHHLRRQGALTSRFIQYSGRLSVSIIVAAELYTWAYSMVNPARRLAKLEELFRDVEIFAFDIDCARKFGTLNAALLEQGIVVPSSDLMIASVALVNDQTLVTHNTKDFKSIPGLRLEDWIAN